TRFANNPRPVADRPRTRAHAARATVAWPALYCRSQPRAGQAHSRFQSHSHIFRWEPTERPRWIVERMAVIAAQHAFARVLRLGDAPLTPKIVLVLTKPILNVMRHLCIVAHRHRAMVKKLGTMHD